MSADSLTLPKIGTRVKRKRLPRPPKFTKAQKVFLTFYCLWTAYSVVMFFVYDRISFLAFAACCISWVYRIVYQALKRPLSASQANNLGWAWWFLGIFLSLGHL